MIPEVSSNHIVFLLLIHFIADFVCQNDTMALKKSHDFGWLFLHVAVYTAVFFVCMGFGALYFQFNFISTLYFVLLNSALHLITDFFTSKINAYHWSKKENHRFFVGIGADQFIHGATLIYTFYWINPLAQ